MSGPSGLAVNSGSPHERSQQLELDDRRLDVGRDVDHEPAGRDTLVFAGSIGEHSPDSRRARICDDLEFLGVRITERKNATPAPGISSSDGVVAARVIPTDEER